jgi:hypothetical protein
MIRIITAGRLAALQAEAVRVPGLQRAAAQADEALQRAVEALQRAADAVARAEAEHPPQAAPRRPTPAVEAGQAGRVLPDPRAQVVPAHGIAYFGPDGDDAGGTPFYPDVYRATCLCGWTQAGDGLSMILALSGHGGTAPGPESVIA